MSTLTQPIATSFALRTTFIWIVVRVAFAAFRRAADAVIPLPQPEPVGFLKGLQPEPVTSLLIAAVVAALVLSDVRAMRERAFLANIGIALRTIALFSFAGALGFEIVAGVLFALLR